MLDVLAPGNDAKGQAAPQAQRTVSLCTWPLWTPKMDGPPIGERGPVSDASGRTCAAHGEATSTLANQNPESGGSGAPNRNSLCVLLKATPEYRPCGTGKRRERGALGMRSEVDLWGSV